MKKLLISAALSVMAAAGAMAQGWTPPGPIKMIIAFAAGGGADTQARMIADEMQNRLGWEVIPEQVTGGGGLNAAVELAGSANDGTVIAMVVTESLGYNNVANGSPVSLDDFTPLSTTAGFQMGIVSQSGEWETFQDVIDDAKAGEEIVFGTMSPKLSDLAYLLGQANDVEFNITQVRGGRAVMNGVVGGDMDLGWMAGIQTGGVKDGTLVNLASGIGKPLDASPDAPLTSEFGLEFLADGYFMFAAPASIPAEAAQAMADAIAEITSDESTDAGALIKRAFGGPTLIQLDDLTAQIEVETAAAEAILAAVQ